MALDRSRLLKNLFAAFSAQGVSLLCSVLMSLIVPKILGVTEYGYWQLFVFYASYTSFFQLGLNDGIYLEHGGEGRGEIDKRLINSEFFVGSTMQLVIAVIIAVGGSVFSDGSDRAFAICAASVYLFVSNAAYYLGYVFQSMNETKKFSYATIIDKAAFLLPLVFCVSFQITDYHVYVMAYLMARLASLAYSLACARDFLNAGRRPLAESVGATVASMRVGFVLTVANISSQLILGLARLVIDYGWGIEAFGKVSFSLSLVNFALQFINQGSMVLFPALRQDKSADMARYFRVISGVLALLMPLVYLLYYPLCIFVSFWLPQYSESVKSLVCLMPVCFYEVQTNLSVVTFLKVRSEPKRLLTLNGIALMVSALGMAICYFLLRDYMAVLFSSVVGIAVRFYVGNHILKRDYGGDSRGLAVWGVGITVVFIVSGSAVSFGASFSLLALLIFAYIVVYRSAFLGLVRRLEGGKRVG